jgi:formylglycine-generating enzyme required for sulfatase activity
LSNRANGRRRGGCRWWKIICHLAAVEIGLQSNVVAVSVAASGPSANKDLILSTPIKLSMSWVPGGEFQMGDLDGIGHDDERPVRSMTLPGFWMMQTEVTRAHFQRFISGTGYEISPGCGYFADGWTHGEALSWQDPGFAQGADHPVTCVSWRDASAFAQWLSDETGQLFTLPSEAQWEYAARARSTTPYSFGEDAGLLCAYANGADQRALVDYPGFDVIDCDDGHTRTAPVASYRANAFGLYDMTGNVWEWVLDCYNGSYQTASGTVDNQQNCERRVYRGGAYGDVPYFLRVALRNRGYPDERRDDVGFRLVVMPPSTQ